ncbi:MAG: hypothetical protein AAF664_07630, partial [Planctomycetota bacterium]
MNETQFQITASEQRVLQTFREYLMTPGKMLCFSGVTSGSTQVQLAYHGENNGKGSVSYLIQPAGVLHVV